MKNTNLFNFQNGMAYALATLGFDNAIPYEPITINSDFFELTEDDIIIPKNPSKWLDTDSMNGMYYSDWPPEKMKKDIITKWVHFYGFPDVVSPYSFSWYTDSLWDEMREVIPLFLNNESGLYDYIVIDVAPGGTYNKYGEQRWEGDKVNYGYVVKVGIINIDENENVTYIDEHNIPYGDSGKQYISIRNLEHVDFLTFYGSTIDWAITEIKII